VKSTLTALVGSLVLAGIAGAQVPPGLKPALDDLLPAANAHDTDRFLKSYAHDSTVVFIYNGTVFTGYDTLRDVQLKAWAKTDVVYSQHGPMSVLTLTPDIVVVTDPLSSRRTAPTGEVKTADFVVTMVCHRRAEGWRIVYVHESSKPAVN
jgi:ketosteroid isomerase-like protein